MNVLFPVPVDWICTRHHDSDAAGPVAVVTICETPVLCVIVPKLILVVGLPQVSLVSLWISKAIVLLPEPPISTIRQTPTIVVVAANVPSSYPVPLATTVEPLQVMVLASMMRERTGAEAPCQVTLQAMASPMVLTLGDELILVAPS